MWVQHVHPVAGCHDGIAGERPAEVEVAGVGDARPSVERIVEVHEGRIVFNKGGRPACEPRRRVRSVPVAAFTGLTERIVGLEMGGLQRRDPSTAEILAWSNRPNEKAGNRSGRVCRGATGKNFGKV